MNETPDVGQLDDAEEIQLERQNLMAENCEEENKKSLHKPAAKFFSDQRHQILYCYVPKVFNPSTTNVKYSIWELKPEHFQYIYRLPVQILSYLWWSFLATSSRKTMIR